MSRAIDTRLLGCAAVLALPASLAVMLLATPGSASPLLSWTVSTLALLTALVVLAAGECAWENSVARARAAGLVGR
ncbi:hypothetical protein BST22_18860 [Mycolicibacterium chubuense]|uniref:Uncharacterized protein n=1 Tax=Mycolicibacterium chubuense TaxID=1800 RepID=A0A0J6VS88_MYCCU|nr:hypothetical protein [Mycolicibacterium chubuense]KMO73900.1 hypothetical protein MCHUDSM44219_03953 [Mycolicibacterium chubuense]ORA48242.1 hypothetical protein BST22_18860 [Mycolicibacterium chubuense]SPX97701.1 Uncharacterised protein [Mycolicibacterium chubuense]